MEADDVIGEQAAYQRLRFGQDGEQAARRPGDVEEEAEAVLRTALAQFLPQREQVIILNPDRVVFLDQRLDGVGEAFVDALIAAGKFAFIFRQIDAIVKERPQGTVGVAVVIFLDILLFEVDGRGGDAFVALKVIWPVYSSVRSPDQPNHMPLISRSAEARATARPPCAPPIWTPSGRTHDWK